MYQYVTQFTIQTSKTSKSVSKLLVSLYSNANLDVKNKYYNIICMRLAKRT
jgi:hypothetical protein